MRTISFVLIVSFLIAPWISPALAEPASAPVAPADPIVAGLTAPVVSPETVLEEVRQFIEARIPRLPQPKSADDWQQIAARIRRDMIEKVVLRGQAADWAKANLHVEWLDTIPGAAANPPGADSPAGCGYSIRKLRFEALPGLWIPALLYVPDKVEGRVPVVLNVNGHDPKGKAVDYKQIRCINQAKRGMIALNPEWFNMGQLKSPGFAHYAANQLDLCGTSAVAPFYLSMKRCLDILLSLPNADPTRVGVAGLSGGGWQTIFISGLDERVSLANPVAGYSSFFTRARFPTDLGDTEQTPCDMATVADYIHLTATRAPHPTLLTFNSKDNCCFASDHALQPLLDAVKPIFTLCGAESNLRWHINDDPGTHNFEQDNRQQLYRMIGDHFYAGQPFDWREIPCRNELKTADELNVPVPEANESFNSLARKMAERLPLRTSGAGDASVRRELLRAAVHLRTYAVQAGTRAPAHQEGPACMMHALKLGNDWTVPATEFRPASPAGTTLILADAGRKTLADRVRQLLDANQTVVAIDPFYFGESTIQQRGPLHAIFVDGVGERPLGIQAGEVVSVARWLQSRDKAPVSLVAVGPRMSTVALVAAACEPNAIGSVQVHEPLKSLKLLIERNNTMEQFPELFCFGLLEQFDIPDIAALVAPRSVQGS